jgi:hypothetical protein
MLTINEHDSYHGVLELNMGINVCEPMAPLLYYRHVENKCAFHHQLLLGSR